jgi:nitroreductase
MVEAAMKAPNGGNVQWTRLLVIDDPGTIAAFGPLYKEAWWAKRRDGEGWLKPEDIPAEAKSYRSAMRLADEIGSAPLIVFVLAEPPGPANSVITCAQNLMLAGRALGIGSTPTTLHPHVMDRFHEMFAIPANVVFHFCVPMGYPRGHFGPPKRKPTSETTYHNRWGIAPDWAPR